MKSSAIFDIYCKEISQFQFLSADKEAELLKEYKKTRSMKAQESIIHSHLRFVVSIALKYERISIDRLIDLIGQGNLGLMNAIESYDCERKNEATGKPIKFSTYAIWHIKKRIIESLEHQGIMRVPRNQTNMIGKILSIKEELVQEIEKEGDNNIMLVAELLKKARGHKYSPSVKKIKDLLMLHTRNRKTSLSTEAPTYEYNTQTISSKNSPEIEEDIDALEKAFQYLTDEEKVIVSYLFGIKNHEQLSHRKLAAKLQCSQQWLWQLKKRILEKLGTHIMRQRRIPHAIH